MLQSFWLREAHDYWLNRDILDLGIYRMDTVKRDAVHWLIELMNSCLNHGLPRLKVEHLTGGETPFL